jgi:integrase
MPDMARTVRDVRLDNRAARLRLEPAHKPYYRLIETGKHIGYYRGRNVGSWIARIYRDGKYLEKKLGIADDIRDGNEVEVLSFSDAQVAARKWFDELARVEYGGHIGPYSVGQACDHYLTEYLARPGKDPVNTKARVQQVKDRFGATDVAKLTKTEVRKWHRELRDTAPLTRNRNADETSGERKRRAVDLADDDTRRKRAASANRILTVLKAILNHEPPEGVTMPSGEAWRSVKPHPGADAPKVRYLKDDEAVRLMNACEPDFRDLVAAALLTGCRYGELRRMRVGDLDAKANTIRVAVSKSDNGSNNGRSVTLSDEGVAHFSRLALGKASDDLLLVRSDGERWEPSQQLRRMGDACAAASIKPAISFHILRHTHGSRLAMRGAPMPVIGAQLGHVGTRITEKHYAHLGPSYVSETVRDKLGTIGVPETTDNVVPLAKAVG